MQLPYKFQLHAAHNLAVGVGKYVRKVDIIWIGGGQRDMALFRAGSPSWLVQINDVSDCARQKRRGEEGGSSLVTDFFEKICSNLFKPTLRRHM